MEQENDFFEEYINISPEEKVGLSFKDYKKLRQCFENKNGILVAEGDYRTIEELQKEYDSMSHESRLMITFKDFCELRKKFKIK